MSRRHRHGDIERFSGMARRYDRAPGQFLLQRIDGTVARALTSATGTPRLIVDVGCGTGRLLEALLSDVPEAELVGVDPAPGMIEVARDRFASEPRVRLEVATAERLPLRDGSAEAVITTLSFHHWEQQGASLREVARVLRPGGRLLVADILGIGLVGRLIRPHGWGHGSGYRSADELSSLLRDAGFSSWRVRRLFGPLVPIFLVDARRATR
ncbi:MAG TPA: methyltransferase domain-containing protein [Candidatus Binatia bacterium]|nr:methyltransferase domain-containing protein [Candidatus Binatia bacterium]